MTATRINHSARRHLRLFAVAAIATVIATSQSFAARDPGLQGSLPELLDFYTAHSTFNLPQLSGHELELLLHGDAVVKVSGQPATDSDEEVVGMGVYGLQVIDAPRLLIWLTLMGGNDERDYRLTPAILSRGSAGSYVRYQHVDLPWPVRDRHWVIRCQKNVPMADASAGVIWEHHWTLEQGGMTQVMAALNEGRIPGLTDGDLQDAIYLPRNRGAWTLIDIAPHRTLVIAYVDAALGGGFPATLVRSFTRRKLKAGLASLTELSARVHLNYSEDRPIHDGYGNPIAKADALRTAANWRNAVHIAKLD